MNAHLNIVLWAQLSHTLCISIFSSCMVHGNQVSNCFSPSLTTDHHQKPSSKTIQATTLNYLYLTILGTKSSKMRPTKTLISIHAMPHSSTHRTSTATWMNVAASSGRPNIFAASSTTTPNKTSFNTIPDSKTRRERLFHQPNNSLPHHQESCLSTTRLHPSLLFLSSMSALDPRPFPAFTRLLARPVTLDGDT